MHDGRFPLALLVSALSLATKENGQPLCSLFSVIFVHGYGIGLSSSGRCEAMSAADHVNANEDGETSWYVGRKKKVKRNIASTRYFRPRYSTSNRTYEEHCSGA